MKLVIDLELRLSKHFQTIHEIAVHDYDDYYLETLKDLMEDEAETFLRSKVESIILKALSDVHEAMKESHS